LLNATFAALSATANTFALSGESETNINKIAITCVFKVKFLTWSNTKLVKTQKMDSDDDLWNDENYSDEDFQETTDVNLLSEYIEDCKTDDFILEALDDSFLWNLYSSDFDFYDKEFDYELEIQALIIRHVI
tara:strand:- start:7679 stop:8074 length:396 start_codon:yes stop_codon:yes gene_type:complete